MKKCWSLLLSVVCIISLLVGCTPTDSASSSASSQGASSRAQVTQLPPVSSQKQTTTVYVTDHGKKYHRIDCQSLYQSCNSISLSQAKQEGYEPCSKCDPPL